MSRAATDIILASGSTARAALLANAEIPVRALAPGVDEDAVKREFKGSADDLALALARAKAEKVSAEHLESFVIGADQVLSCEGRLFDKPADLDQARANLIFLRGRTHRLHSAIALAHQGETVWSTLTTADLTMRPFTDAFLDHYIDLVGDRLLTSVGCYQLEGPGIELFERIDGDYFTILGLPLIPLLAALRDRHLVRA